MVPRGDRDWRRPGLAAAGSQTAPQPFARSYTLCVIACQPTRFLSRPPSRMFRLRGMLHDVRYAVHLFVRRPGVTALIVATLAIGIAASTVVFSVADAVLWHPLPFADPDRLVSLWIYNPAQKATARSIPPAALTAWSAKSTILETVHAYG